MMKITTDPIKSGIKWAAYRSGLYPFVRRSTAGRIMVMLFHRVLDDATPPGNWRRVLGHPTVSDLRSKLCYLRRQAQIISVTDCVRLLDRCRPLDGDYAVLTVDDGYRDFRTNLLPILDDLCIPASLFVCSGAIQRRTVWFNEVYDLIETLGCDRLKVPWMNCELPFGDVRQRVQAIEYRILSHLKTLAPEERRCQIESLRRANGRPGDAGVSPADEFCTVDDLKAIAGNPRVQLHPHGHNHEPFSTLSDEDLQQDIGACLAFFSANLGVQSNVVSYPNGTFRESQWEVLRKIGVTHAFGVQNGYEIPGQVKAMAIRRNGFGGEDIADFAWRVQQLLHD